ncbi:hypothetical protein ASD90_15060 [Terrabacter sp. Root181]|nr:hypothetical protein ASD90_15060 [Terrabacter sp. Root181]
MARYLTTAGGDEQQALTLYSTQARAATVLWQTIGHVEVVMRNAMHDSLCAHSPNWYDRLSVVFNGETKDDIAKARQRVAKYEANETPGHIVAELNFGFWRFLLSRQYDRPLWTPYLYSAFPNYRGRRDTLFQLAMRVNDARNTIAHHQRLADPKAVKRDALELAGHICTHTRDWIRTESVALEGAVSAL